MGGIGDAVGRSLQNLSTALGDFGGSIGRLLGDAFGAVDVSLHHVIPWFIPTWLLAAVVIFIVALFVFRR